MKLCKLCSSQILTGQYKFCSVDCRSKSMNADRREVWKVIRPNIPLESRACKVCDSPMMVYKNVIFCSSKCRTKFHRKKQYVPTPKESKSCPKCSIKFLSRKGVIYCSERCVRAVSRVRNAAAISLRSKAKYHSNTEYRKRVLLNSSRRISLKLKTDPIFRRQHNLRRKMRTFIRRKQAPFDKIIGCTSAELRAWIQAKWKDGMSWENYGKFWVIDHVKPTSSFDLSDDAQIKVAFHYTNLQPLTPDENRAKGTKIVGDS